MANSENDSLKPSHRWTGFSGWLRLHCSSDRKSQRTVGLWATFTKEVQSRRHRPLQVFLCPCWYLNRSVYGRIRSASFCLPLLIRKQISVWQDPFQSATVSKKPPSLTSTYAVDSKGSAFMGPISHEGVAQRCQHSPLLARAKQSQKKLNSR